eukprot:gene15594-21129_t
MGGSNLHQYAPNPSRWIDPLGLSYCAFGNASKPRAPRPGKDIAVDADGMVKSQAGKQFPEGASTTVDPTKSPLSGHYHEIPEGTKMPSGIDIVRDGSDVIPNSPRGPGHATVFPTRDMPFTEFQALKKMNDPDAFPDEWRLVKEAENALLVSRFNFKKHVDFKKTI